MGQSCACVNTKNALDATFFLCHLSAMKNARQEIKQWMRENRMRQYDLAEQVGVTPEQMSRVLTRLTPGRVLRKTLALRTGLAVEDAAAWEAPQ